jgi:glycosyltransferase involved in cell wall biosynthesis
MFSIAILTYNEQDTLGGCLDSVVWADDVLVFDSFSTDRTVEIARERGARVMQHPFRGYASQRNACLELGAFKHPWVFMLDADERFTPELHAEIDALLRGVDAEFTLFRVRRKDYFLGRWIRRAALYPTWLERLMRHEDVRITREINEHCETEGRVGRLREHIVHHPFAKGLSAWIKRHDLYADMEARQRLEDTAPLQWRQMLHPDAVTRRAELKRLAYRTPARPLLIFLYLLVARGAVLEGFSGASYSALRAWYELCIDIKCRELRLQKIAMKDAVEK